jgi:hypothetical protein
MVNDSTVSLSQAAAACTFGVNPNSGTVVAAGGPLTFQLNTVSGCSWTATSDSTWITITSGASGSASGSISLNVATNTGAARTGAVTAGGQIYRVSQDAAETVPAPVPNPTPSPTPSPSPSPSPTPAPSPSPTPQPVPPTISIDGKIDSLSGRCPTVSFRLAGFTVTTASSTTYSKGKCTDLSNGDTLSVDGTLITSTALAATDIAITKNDH